jgi:hypothetical protein
MRLLRMEALDEAFDPSPLVARGGAGRHGRRHPGAFRAPAAAPLVVLMAWWRQQRRQCYHQRLLEQWR